MRYFLVFLVSLLSLIVDAHTEFPCKGTTTTSLNVRTGPSTSYRKLGTFPRNTDVYVVSSAGNGWVKINFSPGTGYVNSRYLEFEPLHNVPNGSSDYTSYRTSNRSRWSFWGIVWKIIEFIIGAYLTCMVLVIAYRIITFILGLGIVVSDVVVRVVCFPFFFLNCCQRYLAKPWFIFLRRYHFSDSVNKVLRIFFQLLKIPFYIVLLPVRLVNAIFFNLILHVGFEMFNYLLEVFFPSDLEEGRSDSKQWILMFPLRLVKYPIYHGSLTIIESVIWTVIDCVFPALTLYHGTSTDAAENIVAHPCRGRWHGNNSGMWIVGGGNFAGNGIYFASARSTAEHYSAGSLIVCRVTLGRTLDLGIAPYRVYSACGYPNATEVTRWGLKNGYVTGEWWRSDAGWWEYCMYDWQNRYNYSWRIRPLYVMNLSDRIIQRIPGGMSHWLFRKIVLKDLLTSLQKALDFD